MKKFISAMLAAVMALSLSVSAFAYEFKDTENSVNSEAIDTLSTLEIINGIGDNKFDPEGLLTRGQICAMLTRAIYGDKVYPSSKQDFTDVPFNHIFRAAIDTAHRNGIMNGYGGGKFGPDDKVTYVQLTAILMNVLGYQAGDFEWPLGVMNQGILMDLYEDVSVVNANAPVTRAHAAQMIYNIFNDDLVYKIGNTYMSTNESFLTHLGFEKNEKMATKGDNAGHTYVVYIDKSEKKDSEDYYKFTDIETSYSKEAVMTDNDTYRIGRDTKNITWSEVRLFVNGSEISGGRSTKLVSGNKVDLIFNDKNEMIAVSYIDDNYFVVRTPVNTSWTGVDSYDKDTIIHDKDFNTQISTVSYNKTSGSYFISNEYIIDIVKRVEVLPSGLKEIHLMNGDSYIYNIAVEANDVVIIYFDYENEISGVKNVTP